MKCGGWAGGRESTSYKLASITYVLWFTISQFAFMKLPPPVVRRNKRKRDESDASDSISSRRSKTNSSESPYGFQRVSTVL